MAEDDRNDELTPEDEDATVEEQPEAEAEAPEEAAVEEEPAAEEEAAAEEEPAPEAEEPVAEAEEPAAEAEEPAAEAPAEEAAPAAEAEAPAAEAEAPAAEERRQRRPERPREEKKPDVIPGEHLEPILPVEQPTTPEGEFDYAAYAEEEELEEGAEGAEAPVAEEAAPAPTPLTPKELAADARYQATGKRKTSVARVILKPGTGTYVVNGRTLEDFFPRATLQKAVRQPLETAGYEERMDVVARIHGGGVSAQAGALRHGLARALVEADPNLRGELKRRGFLTRDARAKERKKAGLKKARKRPQFSKR